MENIPVFFTMFLTSNRPIIILSTILSFYLPVDQSFCRLTMDDSDSGKLSTLKQATAAR